MTILISLINTSIPLTIHAKWEDPLNSSTKISDKIRNQFCNSKNIPHHMLQRKTSMGISNSTNQSNNGWKWSFLQRNATILTAQVSRWILKESLWCRNSQTDNSISNNVTMWDKSYRYTKTEVRKRKVRSFRKHNRQKISVSFNSGNSPLTRPDLNIKYAEASQWSLRHFPNVNN